MAGGLPDIKVTTTDPSTVDGGRNLAINTSRTHGRSHSEHLSLPGTGASNKHFLDPGSPTPTLTGSNEEGPITVPPSPTLSASSVQFATSVALRANKPEESTGLSSLSLLKPCNQGSRHARTGSSASSHVSFEGTEPDHHDDKELNVLHHVQSEASMTLADSVSHAAKSSKSDGGRPITELERTTTGQTSAGKRPESTRASSYRSMRPMPVEDIDPSPFAFKPTHLASLLDPKNLEALTNMGGIDKLLLGLGTHPTKGLAKMALRRSESSGDGDQIGSEKLVTGSGSHEVDTREHEVAKQDVESPLPGIVVTSPAGDIAEQARASKGGHEDADSELYSEFEEFGSAYTASLDRRRRIYGENVLPHRPSKTLLQLMWLAFKDKVLILLSIAAVVSLALGLFQDLGPSRRPGHNPVDWVEGVAIMVAIVIVVVVGSVNDWQKERQFQQLNEKTEERGVKVIRDGVERIINVKEVVVGDVALLEPGEIVPCDGIFLSGHNVKCDESGATGESDAIKKVSYRDCVALRDKERQLQEDGAFGGNHAVIESSSSHTDCFILSGAKVSEGVGSYVVIAVGQKSFNGRILMALRGDPENTPLQMKLNDLAEVIAKIGSVAGLLFFAALMIKFFVQLGTGQPKRNANENGIAFVNNLIIAVTVIVVAVPEGLPLAVTLALAFATKRMSRENLLVRVLGSCETMANASVVCTDKTGTLTQNRMTVVAGSIGIHAKFVRNLAENQERTNADERHGPTPSAGPNASTPKPQDRKHPEDFSLDQSDLDDVLSPQLRTLFNEAICVNSTAFEDTNAETGEVEFVGSKTETALLKFAKEFGWPDYKHTRDAARIVQAMPFSSQRKAMGVVIKLPSGKHRIYLKGASEILTKKCTRHVVVSRDASSLPDPGETVSTSEIDAIATDNIQRTIIFYANQTLRTIALCYRDFDSWPPAGSHYTDIDEVDYDDLACDLTLIGIVGIEDPLRPGVREAVAKCQRAGVAVKMCTGDNVLTARSIALQCGIYSAGGIIMEGPVFRELSDNYMLAIVPRLQVLARSSPEDKKILVEKLKELGEVVGVTGDGTNDGPALKTAHVGFAMGIAGTEVAKEASDIILMDDNFASIVKAVIWGRCVNDAVRKFLQFQLSTNVTAVIVTIVSAISAQSEQSVLTAVQLLWVNIIMDTFAALALATDHASEKLLERKPESKTAPLFSVDMYKQIFFQSLYQVVITLVFHFRGMQILGFASGSDSVARTFVFNTFVFAQIFNSLNCRRLDRHLNVFEGILRNGYFLSITVIEIAVQILIVFIGGAAFQVTALPAREWGISIALGVFSIPLGAVVRLLPNEPFEKLFKLLRLLPRRTALLPTTQPEWSPAIEKVRDGLRTFTNLRGGRIRSSSFVVKSRIAQIPKEPPPRISALLTMIPTLVVSGVTTNWKQQGGSLSDPASADPSKSSAALWEGHGEVHPDTRPDDPAYRLLGFTKSAGCLPLA